VGFPPAPESLGAIKELPVEQDPVAHLCPFGAIEGSPHPTRRQDHIGRERAASASLGVLESQVGIQRSLDDITIDA